jgi:hypothetical protein
MSSAEEESGSVSDWLTSGSEISDAGSSSEEPEWVPDASDDEEVASGKI